MKLTWHIVRKDFMRLKWALAAWALCHVAKIGIGFAIIGDSRFATVLYRGVESTVFGLTGISWLLTFVITAMLVQEDGLVGTTSFWVTRPISSGRLLAAKLLGWLLLLWLPAVLLALPWWLACAFGPAEIGRAALEILVVQVVLSLPAALVASLTDSLGRVLIWSFVLLFAGVTIPMMTYWWAGKGISPVQTVAGWIVFVAVIVAVILRQYFRRGFVRSLVWLGAGVLLAPVAAIVMGVGSSMFLPRLEELQGKPKWSEHNTENAKDISLSYHSFIATSDGRSDNSKDSFLYSNLAVRGVPPGLLVAGDFAKQTWRWAGGVEITRDQSWVHAWGMDSTVHQLLAVGAAKVDPETQRFQIQQRERAAKRQGVAYARRVQAFGNVRASVPLGAEVSALVGRSLVERMKSDPPAYEARVQLALLRPEVWFELPLQPGGWNAHAAFGFRVGKAVPTTSVERHEGDDGKFQVERRTLSALRVVYTMPGFLWETFFNQQNWMREQWRQPTFYIVNRAGGDFHRQYLYYRYPRLVIASVGINADTIRISPPQVRRGEQWLPRDENWVDAARLVLVGYREEARFSREVKAERFENPKEQGVQGQEGTPVH